MVDDNPLIARAVSQIEEYTARVQELQAWVNQADALEGREPRFGATQGIALPTVSSGGPTAARGSARAWAPGAFFGKPLASAVRLILVSRQEAVGGPAPASVDEIHAALSQGSFDFETTNADAQKNGIRISLGKNSTAFVRLPNSDLFGMVEWYGTRGRKASRKTTNAENDDDRDAGNEAAPDENSTEGNVT